MGSLATLLDLVATLATSFFCGAAIYITLVEHPARMQLPIREAARQFGKSYPRAAVLQPAYIFISCIVSGLRYFGAVVPVSMHKQSLQALQQAHLVNLILMSGCAIWTMVYMIPGNKALLAAERESTDRVKQLLQAWGWQHSLRTVASGVATVILLAAVSGSN